MPAAHQDTVSFIDRLSAQLDKDQPRWYIEWATGSELAAYSDACARISETTIYGKEPLPINVVAGLKNTRQILKTLVANRLFHRILNSALGAGIIKDL